MPGTSGLRRKTRHQFSRGFGQHGYIPLTVYLRPFKVGDYVDIKVNAAIHKVCRRRQGRKGREGQRDVLLCNA